MLRLVAVVAAAVVMTSALPSSILTDVHTARNQAKRAQEVLMFGNQQNRPADTSSFYQAIKKRAAPADDDLTSTVATDTTEASNSDADDTRRGHDLLEALRQEAAASNENTKTVAEYEKGYQYGVGKEAMQKQAENSLLKSDVYGDPVNEYRYYGGGDHQQSSPDKRSARYASTMRLKRDLELDPEALMALIALWQSQRNSNNYAPGARERLEWPKYGYERLEENDVAEDDEEDEDATNGEWYENPVTPGRYYDPPQYHYNAYPPSMKRSYYPTFQRFEKKRLPTGQWGGFTQDKRFMVSKKRQFDRWDDPMLTRLLASQPREMGLVPQRRVIL